MNVNTSRTINYSQITPEQLLEVFENNNVYFDRALRIAALRKVIETKYSSEKKELEKMKAEKSNEMSIKEFIRLNRLESSSTLSEYQLEADYQYYDDKNINDLYLNLLWDKLAMHILSLDNAEAIFDDIDNLEKSDYTMKNVCKYNQVFYKRVLDENDFFDGIHLVDAVRHFNETSVAIEIRKLSEKYMLDIPKYWKKKDLQLRIKRELKVRQELTAEITETINTSSVKKLQVLCEELNIDPKLHITKTDMIDMIIKNVDKNKVSEVAKIVEVVIEDPVVEEVPVVEVVEEVVVPEVVEVPVVLENGKDYEDLLKQIIANQGIIIKQNEEANKYQPTEQSNQLNKIFNYIVITLIVIVALIWIIYGIGTLF